MTAEAIRKLIASYPKPGTGNFKYAGGSPLMVHEIALLEIAAQLAEQNDKLERIASAVEGLERKE